MRPLKTGKSLRGDSWKCVHADFQTKFLFTIFGFTFTYLLTLASVMLRGYWRKQEGLVVRVLSALHIEEMSVCEQ